MFQENFQGWRDSVSPPFVWSAPAYSLPIALRRLTRAREKTRSGRTGSNIWGKGERRRGLVATLPGTSYSGFASVGSVQLSRSSTSRRDWCFSRLSCSCVCPQSRRSSTTARAYRPTRRERFALLSPSRSGSLRKSRCLARARALRTLRTSNVPRDCRDHHLSRRRRRRRDEKHKWHSGSWEDQVTHKCEHKPLLLPLECYDRGLSAVLLWYVVINARAHR